MQLKKTKLTAMQPPSGMWKIIIIMALSLCLYDISNDILLWVNHVSLSKLYASNPRC